MLKQYEPFTQFFSNLLLLYSWHKRWAAAVQQLQLSASLIIYFFLTLIKAAHLSMFHSVAWSFSKQL